MADTMNLKLMLDLIDNSTRESQRVIRQLEKIDKTVNKIDKDQKKMNSNSKKASKEMSNSFKNMNKGVGLLSSKFAALAAGGAITGIFVKGTQSALAFEKQMAEVSTLTGQSASTFTKNFTPVVESIQRSFGKDQQDVVKALYDGISAGVPATQSAARDFLKAVGKMSIAGVTDMKTAGDAITTVTNAWKSSGVTFEQASNTMFGAVRAGKTTMAELSASVGQVATIAEKSGASIEETFAGIAALTSVGVKTPQAVTQLAGALKALVAPAEESKKAFADLGIKSIGALKNSFKDNKIVNTLREIDRRLKKTTRSSAEYDEKLKKLFPDIEAFKAVSALAGNAQDKFNQALVDTNRNGGQAVEAYNKMQTASLDYDRAMQELAIAGKNIGMVLVPYLATAAKFISEIFQNIRGIVDNAAHIEQLNRQEKQEKQMRGYARSKLFQENTPLENTKALLFGASKERKAKEEKYYQEERMKREKAGTLETIHVMVEATGLLPENKKTAGAIADAVTNKINEKLSRTKAKKLGAR